MLQARGQRELSRRNGEQGRDPVNSPGPGTHELHTGVCEKEKSPPDTNTLGKTGFRSTKPGGGEQLLFLPYHVKRDASGGVSRTRASS